MPCRVGSRVSAMNLVITFPSWGAEWLGQHAVCRSWGLVQAHGPRLRGAHNYAEHNWQPSKLLATPCESPGPAHLNERGDRSVHAREASSRPRLALIRHPVARCHGWCCVLGAAAHLNRAPGLARWRVLAWIGKHWLAHMTMAKASRVAGHHAVHKCRGHG